jgi:hypothetical protein
MPKFATRPTEKNVDLLALAAVRGHSKIQMHALILFLCEVLEKKP